MPPRPSRGSPGGARPRTQFRRAPGPLAHAQRARARFFFCVPTGPQGERALGESQQQPRTPWRCRGSGVCHSGDLRRDRVCIWRRRLGSCTRRCARTSAARVLSARPPGLQGLLRRYPEPLVMAVGASKCCGILQHGASSLSREAATQPAHAGSVYIRAAHHRSAAPPACTRRTRWGSCPPERHPVGAAPAQPLTPPQGRRRRRRREHHWRHAGAAVGACVIRMIGASARPPMHDLFHTLACSLAPLLVRLRARPLARSQERLFMRDINIIISSKRRTEPSSQHDRAPGIRARRQGEGRESTREENNIAPHYTSQERATVSAAIAAIAAIAGLSKTRGGPTLPPDIIPPLTRRPSLATSSRR